MSFGDINPWIDSFIREAGIRKSLIVDGNVNDVCLNKHTSSYDTSLKVIIDALKKDKKFDEVVVWDRFSGVRNISANNLEELRMNSVLDSETSNSQDQNNEDSGDESDILSSYEASSNTHCDPDDFFPIVYHALINETKKRYAFIVDWSQYLFGNANSLNEKERNWLIILSKAIRDSANGLEIDTIEKPSNLLVLFTSSLGNIPPIYYQNNPYMKHIQISIPSRKSREKFMIDNIHKFKISKVINQNDSEFADFIDFLDNFTLADIQQLIKLSRQVQEILSFEKLVNLYKYGIKKSPWEELSKDKLLHITDTLKKRVKGQDEAIEKIRRVILRAYTGFSGLQHSAGSKKPKGTLFFVGPTGVGKTELAKSLAEFLFGDENACIRFDMSEFNHEHSDQRLIGAPPGYVGYEAGGQLTNAVKAKPFCVLLFDEIEKAHGKILDKFLQILEDGRLTDGKGETVYFSESVIIFTSNIGAAEVVPHEDKEVVRKQFIEKVNNHFTHTLKRPELLNRIGDNIIAFNFISNNDVLLEIAKVKMNPLKKFIKERHKMDLIFEDEGKALEAITKVVNKKHGGRGVLNVIEPNIIDPLSDFAFENNDYFSPGKKIKIVQAGNTANFDFELE